MGPDKGIEGRQYEDIGRDGSLQATERDLERILLSQLSAGTKPADILILDSEPPELVINKLLLFQPLCYTALTNIHNGI